MFSMTKSKELDKEQQWDTDVNKRHYGEDIKFYLTLFFLNSKERGKSKSNSNRSNSINFDIDNPQWCLQIMFT